MRRRDFVGLLIGWPLIANAQKVKIARIGVLSLGPAGISNGLIDGFYQGMRDLGYTEGQNIIIERRYGDWASDRFHHIASELVALKVDVIVVISTSRAQAAQQATRTIPIVVAGMADPVEDGLVATLAKPGRNITGTTFIGPELTSKRFGLLKAAIPRLSRVAALWHPTAYGKGTMTSMVKEVQASAQELGLRLELVEVSDPTGFETAFASMNGNHADAFMALNSPMFYTEYKRIVTLAAKSVMPSKTGTTSVSAIAPLQIKKRARPPRSWESRPRFCVRAAQQSLAYPARFRVRSGPQCVVRTTRAA